MIRPEVARISFALAVAVASGSRGARAAQDQAAIEKLVQMNKKALDDYDTLEWESAKKTLLDALVAGKKAGLDNHPVMARTYVHLGAVYITGFRDRDKAIQSFARALEIDPAIQLSKGIATQEVNDAFAEAKQAAGRGRRTAAASSAAAAARRSGRRARHGERGARSARRPPRRRNAGDARRVGRRRVGGEGPARQDQRRSTAPTRTRRSSTSRRSCAAPSSPNLPRVAKVYLMYRSPGKEKYTELEMTKTPKGWCEGEDPEEGGQRQVGLVLLRGAERRRQAGGQKRRGDEPELILLREEEAAYRKLKEKEFGQGRREPARRRQDGAKENLLGHRRRGHRPDVRFGNRKWWIGLGAGSGFGYAKGKGLEAVNRSTRFVPQPGERNSCPVAPGRAFCHLAPGGRLPDHAERRGLGRGALPVHPPAGAVLAFRGDGRASRGSRR